MDNQKELILNFHHIGIFVENLEEGQEILKNLIPIKIITPSVSDNILKVRVQFCIDTSNIRYELVSPFGENNPVVGILKSGKNILNHVAYVVKNVNKEMIRLRKQGCLPLDEPKPAIIFNGKKVVFLLTPMRFIIELIEE